MKQQDKLRNSLREYYDTQEVAFNDNEWERASAYLSTARRRRRIRNYAFILTALFSTLFIALFNFPRLSNGHKHQASSFSNQKLKSVPASQSATLRVPTASGPKQETSIHSTLNKRSEYSTHVVILTPGAGRNSSKEHTFLPFGAASQVFEAEIAASEPVLSEKQNTLKESLANTTDPIVAPVTDVDVTSVDNNSQVDMKTEVTEDPKENTEIVQAAVENSTPDQNQFPAKEILQVPMDAVQQPATTFTLNDNKKEIVVAHQVEFTDLKEKVAPIPFDTAGYSISEGVSDALERTNEDTITQFLGNLANEGIFYEAGAAWNHGWKGPAHSDARGFSPVAGINYMNRLTRRCAISFGLQYLQVNNLSNSSKTSRVSSYVYGESSSVTVVTPTTLHYLVAPLRFHYYADRRNSFGLGINLAYLLNVDAKVTSYDEKPGFTGNYRTVKLSGYTQGFSWFDSQLAFFYRRRIGKLLALQAEIFIGLTDVKQDEFFGFNNKERNSGAKLSLVYFACRKKDKR